MSGIVKIHITVAFTFDVPQLAFPAILTSHKITVHKQQTKPFQDSTDHKRG